MLSGSRLLVQPSHGPCCSVMLLPGSHAILHQAVQPCLWLESCSEASGTAASKGVWELLLLTAAFMLCQDGNSTAQVPLLLMLAPLHVVCCNLPKQQESPVLWMVMVENGSTVCSSEQVAVVRTSQHHWQLAKRWPPQLGQRRRLMVPGCVMQRWLRSRMVLMIWTLVPSLIL